MFQPGSNCSSGRRSRAYDIRDGTNLEAEEVLGAEGRPRVFHKLLDLGLDNRRLLDQLQLQGTWLPKLDSARDEQVEALDLCGDVVE